MKAFNELNKNRNVLLAAGKRLIIPAKKEAGGGFASHINQDSGYSKQKYPAFPIKEPNVEPKKEWIDTIDTSSLDSNPEVIKNKDYLYNRYRIEPFLPYQDPYNMTTLELFARGIPATLHAYSLHDLSKYLLNISEEELSLDPRTINFFKEVREKTNDLPKRRIALTNQLSNTKLLYEFLTGIPNKPQEKLSEKNIKEITGDIGDTHAHKEDLIFLAKSINAHIAGVLKDQLDVIKKTNEIKGRKKTHITFLMDLELTLDDLLNEKQDFPIMLRKDTDQSVRRSQLLTKVREILLNQQENEDEITCLLSMIEQLQNINDDVILIALKEHLDGRILALQPPLVNQETTIEVPSQRLLEQYNALVQSIKEAQSPVVLFNECLHNKKRCSFK